MVERLPVGAAKRERLVKVLGLAFPHPNREIRESSSLKLTFTYLCSFITLLLQPGAPEAALGVSVFLPRTALPVLHLVAPDEVPIIGPADHIVSHIIDKILLSKFVPDRQTLGAVGLFHVLGYQLFILGRANPRDVSNPWFTADAANILLVRDQRLTNTARTVYGNIQL